MVFSNPPPSCLQPLPGSQENKWGFSGKPFSSLLHHFTFHPRLALNTPGKAPNSVLSREASGMPYLPWAIPN